MKSGSVIVAAISLLCASDVNAFSSFSGQKLQSGVTNGRSLSMEYVPS
jgi:hypothetical protein